MQYVADLHLHSKYSRAVSQDMTLSVMDQYAREKGLDILTAADWTHPLWFKEMSRQLEEMEEGIYRLKGAEVQREKGAQKETLFLLSTEIASIYKQADKLRRIHNLVFVPNLDIADKVSRELIKRGCNLSSDGRPIIGLSSKDLLQLILEIDEQSFLIPCHVWTPHFGLYGSASGFDSIEESFGELGKYIYGIETGISSDPEMNWQIEELKHRSILSFSDAHSPAKMGREATVFVNKNGISNNAEKIAYEDIRQAIMRKSEQWKVGYTIEFYPEEGKYHYSGHRNCNVVRSAEEIKHDGNICPVCRKKLTEGVFLRVEQLANLDTKEVLSEKKNEYGLKWYVDKTRNHPPYVKLVPLLEIIAEAMGFSVASQKVKNMYTTIIKDIGSELDVLLKTPVSEVEKVAGEKIAEGIQKVRGGDIVIDPGYDGVYGKVSIWQKEDMKQKEVPQLRLEL